ncbi:uncharacterized protein [Watersipora subatra]|uniref:uncharacterized protein n=1 Tax=Watersipora subatra TaxID=2589382 RepID=UPI00355C7936
MASPQKFDEGGECSPELMVPRALPCGHVNCTQCLETKYKIHKGVRCETCDAVDRKLDIESLPIASVHVSNHQTAVTCDKLECNNTAYHFCGDKRCNGDLELHEKFVRKVYKVISTKKFKQTAGKYQKSFCKHHKSRRLIKACEKCEKLICNLCDRSEGECSDYQPELC